MLEDFRLKLFMTVLQERSFTSAARKLDISQPAVSQNILELEKQVGVRLLERQRGSVVPTEEGKTFALFADRIIRAYDDLNAVFNDYPAYEDMARRVRDIAEDPCFNIFKGTLTK